MDRVPEPPGSPLPEETGTFSPGVFTVTNPMTSEHSPFDAWLFCGNHSCTDVSPIAYLTGGNFSVENVSLSRYMGM